MNTAAPDSPPVNKLDDDFCAGVTACLRSWSALQTAVESGWGGAQSRQKAEELRRHIYDYFATNKQKQLFMDDVLDDLQDNLALILEEEFSVILEDGSDRQVAETIWRLYEECCLKGSNTFAQQVVASANKRAAVLMAATTGYPSSQIIQSSEHDDDDDDDDDEDMMDVNETSLSDGGGNMPATTTLPPLSPSEYASQPLFGAAPKHNKNKKPKQPEQQPPVRQLGEERVQEATPPQVEVDEDGFAPVKPKGRRKR